MAVVIWIYGSPGIARAIAFNVILIGGVSTLLFNGNPLLRFDGYYIFSDLIEVPNLATRANSYLFYVIQKYLFKIDSLESPVAEPSEAKWLICYAVLSFSYRMIVSIGIALFLSTRLTALSYLVKPGSPALKDGRPTPATHRQTTVVRKVTLGPPPDRLFEPLPSR